jgi:CRISPR-associated protein Csx17
MRGVNDQALPLRAQLFPVHPRYGDWIDSACKAKGSGNDRACRTRLHRPGKGDLVATLIDLLVQRLTLIGRMDLNDKPLQSSTGIDVADLSALLADTGMDAAITTLLPGLALCEIPPGAERSAGDTVAPAAFALSKLTLTTDATLHSLGLLPRDQRIPVPPQMVAKLASGNHVQADQAIQIAWRRLRGTGLVPAMTLKNRPRLAGIDPRRLAAALLVPLSYGATGALARAVLK